MIQVYLKEVNAYQYNSTINFCILLRKLGIQTRIKSIQTEDAYQGFRGMRVEVDRGIGGLYESN